VLSGSGLEKYKTVVTSSAGNGQVLECASPPEIGEWFRRCGNLPGEKSIGPVETGTHAIYWESGGCCT
jgi:hypothetical protein